MKKLISKIIGYILGISLLVFFVFGSIWLAVKAIKGVVGFF